MKILELLIFILIVLLATLKDKIIVIKILAITIVTISSVCIAYDIVMLIKNKRKAIK